MTISANYPTVNPSLNLDFANSVALDPRISYSRSTTGTYYDGKTSALAEQNLVPYSQAFASWSATGVVATNNSTTAPDNNSTASLITAQSGSSIHSVAYDSVGNYYTTSTVSVYAKAGTSNFITLVAYNNVGTNLWSAMTVNLSTGAITQQTTSNYTQSNQTVTSVGNGWYRCSFTSVFTTTPAWAAKIVTVQINSTGTPTQGNYGLETWNSVTGTETVYLWGGQLELRSGVGAYQPTTTAAITNYIPVLQSAPINTARLDYDPVSGVAKGLLMEQQSTNLHTQSGSIGLTTGNAWGTTGSSVALNSNIAPDGSLSATLLTEDSSTGYHVVYGALGNYITFTNGTVYTTTVYAKAGTRSILCIGSARGNNNFGGYFNLATGQVGTVTGTGQLSCSMTQVGNGWYRCVSSVTGDGAQFQCHISLCSADNVSSYPGNGSGNAYIWGAQVEALAYPTSYIPTVGSQVTRAQDFASITGTNFSSWFNPAQGSLYCETTNPLTSTGTTGTLYSVNDGTSNTRAEIRGWSNGYAVLFNSNSFSGQSDFPATRGTAGTLFKSMLSYGGSGDTSAVSGAMNTQFSALPIPANQLNIGTGRDGPSTGWYKKVAYYPLRITNAQLQALTGS